jgi:hypothetical protein
MKTNSLNMSKEQVLYNTEDTSLSPLNALLIPYPILPVIEYPTCKMFPDADLGLYRHNLSKLQLSHNTFHYYHQWLDYNHVSPKRLQ